MSDLEQRINIYLSNNSTTAMGFEENIDVYDMMKDALMEFVPQEIEQLQKQIEEMKCVQNCKYGYDGQYENRCHIDYNRNCNKDCKFCKDWEFQLKY